MSVGRQCRSLCKESRIWENMNVTGYRYDDMKKNSCRGLWLSCAVLFILCIVVSNLNYAASCIFHLVFLNHILRFQLFFCAFSPWVCRTPESKLMLDCSLSVLNNNKKFTRKKKPNWVEKKIFYSNNNNNL